MPLCLDDRGRWRRGRRTLYLDLGYARAVQAAGGVALQLPLADDASPLLDLVDGLLLPGGDDLAPPVPYPPDVVFDLVPEAQLAFDRALLRGALERGLPILAVCYGMQLLALECGGRLHYDIASDLPDAGEHRPSDPEARHALHVVRGSRLAELLGEPAEPVSSRHHQAVAEPGRGLVVSARTEDGVVEGIERPGEPFCLGVQWHPESQTDSGSRRLFGAFVEACRQGG
jgi:putative glutamine amidotransferase